MEASEELLTIAELAIGLAGFSGIVVAFTRQGGLRDFDRFYFVALLSCAGTAALLAFVPSIFHHAGLAGPTVWARSSCAMLGVWVVLVCSLLAYGYTIEGFMGTYHLGKATTGVVCAIPVLNVPFQIANVVGWPVESGPVIYLVGLILWLAVSAMMFAYLVLVGAQSQE